MVSAALPFQLTDGHTREDPALRAARRVREGTDTRRLSDSALGLPHRPQRFARSWPLQPATIRLAAIHARTWLAIWRWLGDQDNALRILRELVENAVKHPQGPPPDAQVELVLRITEDDELLMDVSDPDPTFPRFEDAVLASASTGLGLVQQLAEDITWGTPDIARGKTVRARLLPTQS
jgi:hypothetical protein